VQLNKQPVAANLDKLCLYVLFLSTALDDEFLQHLINSSMYHQDPSYLCNQHVHLVSDPESAKPKSR